ncbi:MAG: hypothetical protein ACYDD1_01990 [Caulobacteraceae bacterium]
MSRTVCVSLGCMTVGMTLTGCVTAPVQTAAGYASEGAHATYGAASTGAHAVYSTGGQVYMGVGQAAKKPFNDLNMMQDPIPVVLLRTESKPYDLEGMNSCERILNQVAELDLALGPDLDAPKDHGRSRVSRGADAAAVATLDAAADAAEHFIPMTSVIKRVSGATRYENHVKHAILAGTVRRAFLKAIGMAHNCGWPASPLVFNATDVAMASTAWGKPGDATNLQMVAIAKPAPLAVPPVGAVAQVMTASVGSPSTAVSRQTAPVVTTVATRTVSVQTTTLQTAPAPTAAMQTVATAPAAAMQTVATAPAAAPIVLQRVVKVSSTETVSPPASTVASGYYPAASSYAAPTATAASFASSGPAAPWATPQH